MKRRPGFVLAVVLMALVIIAALVAGAQFATNQETHVTESELLATRAAGFAERVSLGRVATWNAAACDSLAVGAVIVETAASDPPFESTVYVTRLDSAVFLIVGEGRIASPDGAQRIRRRIGILVKISRDAQSVEHVQRVSEQAWAAIYTM